MGTNANHPASEWSFRLREQRISMERLKLERARFELDVVDLVMKHIDKLNASRVLELSKIRDWRNNEAA